jgi:hypothetical protein
MSYDFRVRGVFGSSTRVEADAYELVLLDAPPVRVTLHASGTEVMLKDSRIFIVHGTGFVTPNEAREQGEAWQDYVVVGLASQKIGADLGVRVPLQGGMTTAGFDRMRAAIEAEGQGPVQLFNERSGVQVYATEPPAFFSHGSATGVVGKSSDSVVNAIRSAHTADVRLSDSYKLAYDLFSASYTQIPADARFLMLAMALETMIVQHERSAAVQTVLDQMIDQARHSGLDESESASLIGALREMKLRESVNQAGKRLARTLGERTYGDRSPARFFKDVYELRSQLVHGHVPQPDHLRIGLEASHLQQFVSDLLTIAMNDHRGR